MAQPYNITQVDLPGVFAAVQRDKSAQTDDAYKKMQMMAAQRTLDQEDQYSALMKDPDATPQQAAAISPAYGKQMAEFQAAIQATDGAKLKAAWDQNQKINQLIGSVTDQDSYDRARITASQMGLPVSNLPSQYDPNKVAQMRQQNMTVSDMLKQESDRRQAANQDRTYNQQERHFQVGQETTRRGQDMTDKRAQNKPNKPLPVQAVKLITEEKDAIGTAASIGADLSGIIRQIDDGSLDLGPVNNIISAGRNFAGQSTKESRNYQSFKSTLEKLRNDSLRLNKGVQTDGDSQRAWNELLTNINDPQVVRQRLEEIKKINERAVNLRKMNIDGINANYGREPEDTSGYENQANAVGAGGGTPMPQHTNAGQNDPLGIR